MKSREALRELAEVSESQWGMVTSAQANARGVSHMNLTRLAESGDLVRLSHGVYRDAGAPPGEHDELRSAWLATEPRRLAWERLAEKPGTVVVSGESAAVLHGIGDLRAMRQEFTTRVRKQTQRSDVHFRTRTLSRDDVTVRDGLPVTTTERTIADLIEQRTQLDHVGNALRDAVQQSDLDTERLTELLNPLAERNGHAKGDGAALFEELLEAGHIDLQSLAKQVGKTDLGALVARDYLASIDLSTLGSVSTHLARAVSEALKPVLPVLDSLGSIAAKVAALDSAGLHTVLDAQTKQLTAIYEVVSKLMTQQGPGLEGVRNAIAQLDAQGAAFKLGSSALPAGEALRIVRAASVAQGAKPVRASTSGE